MTWSFSAAGDKDAVVRQLDALDFTQQYDPTGVGEALKTAVTEALKAIEEYPHSDVVFTVQGNGHSDNHTFNVNLVVQPHYVPKGSLTAPTPAGTDALGMSYGLGDDGAPSGSLGG